MAEPEQPAQEPSTSAQATGGQEHLVLLAYSYGSCVAAHLLQMCPEASAALGACKTRYQITTATASHPACRVAQ